MTIQEWKENTLQSLIENYVAKDIFNTDETGLLFSLLPDKTLNVKGKLCNGRKTSKMRLTVLLCVNRDGSEKLTPLDERMGLQKQKTIFFVDRCTIHINLNFKNVQIQFFPANCTS